MPPATMRAPAAAWGRRRAGRRVGPDAERWARSADALVTRDMAWGGGHTASFDEAGMAGCPRRARRAATRASLSASVIALTTRIAVVALVLVAALRGVIPVLANVVIVARHDRGRRRRCRR